MAKSTKIQASKGPEKELSPYLQIDRGTNDELEILREIVSNTAAVRTQILSKLREAKARMQKKEGG